MVTCTPTGGLCNQLFIISQLISHALKYNLDYCVPKQVDNPHYKDQEPYIFSGVKYCEADLNIPIYKEKEFTYEEVPLVDNVCFSGYFQSWKYFDDYREQILKAFGFKYERKKNFCSIHIRLSDYLSKPDCHPPITKGYLFEAMMNIMTRVQDWEAIKFLVFSDSPTMAKEMLSSREFNSFPIEYSEGKNEIEDLELASSCDFSIGSNSAYSLWIYYLNQNPNKVGVFPRIWFGKELLHDTKYLYPPGTIIL